MSQKLYKTLLYIIQSSYILPEYLILTNNLKIFLEFHIIKYDEVANVFSGGAAPLFARVITRDTHFGSADISVRSKSETFQTMGRTSLQAAPTRG